MPTIYSYDFTKIFYEISGDGPPLVCLAGGPGADVRELGDLGGLARDRTVIFMDARGAGRSSVPHARATCAFTDQARDVEALRSELRLDRFDLLAHSAGTLTAQAYAAGYPRLNHLVLVTPAGRLEREPDEAEVAAIRDAKHVTKSPGDVGTTPPAWLRDAFYADVPDADARLARLGEVTTPVLAVAGELDDRAGTGTSRLIGATYPNATVSILSGCGHFPWLDDPDAFRETVIGFLDR
ncbi:MAG TPA: alpha/beta hydrolase [Micromonosporaceae bacterium]|jgi:pimeloyl-ACP methyl ester carboxylesterase